MSASSCEGSESRPYRRTAQFAAFRLSEGGFWLCSVAILFRSAVVRASAELPTTGRADIGGREGVQMTILVSTRAQRPPKLFQDSSNHAITA